MSVELDLSGRRVLITGAGQGVGRGLALAFGAAGAEVLVNDLRGDRAGVVADEVRACDGAASAIPFDVTDFAAVTDALAAETVDVLVNNAGNAGAEGFAGRMPFAESAPADWDPFLRVNLYANGAAYAAAKAGAAGLIRSVALENGRYGITANNIALGTMRTPLTEPLWSDMADSPQAKAILQGYAIRRPGVPDDVTALAVLLAGDHAAWITGQTIPVNGGYSFAL